MLNALKNNSLLLMAFLLLCHCQKTPRPQSSSADEVPQKTVLIQTNHGQVAVSAEVADTPEKRAQGLMYREELAENSGMLFIFDEEILSSFWMENTPLSLDIIFADTHKNIVYIAENTVPFSRELITPNTSFRYVLEVNAGFSAKHSIEVGAVLIFE